MASKETRKFQAEIRSLQKEIEQRTQKVVFAFEIGRKLLLLKSTVAHGEFLKSVSSLEIPSRMAVYYMKIAKKFGAHQKRVQHLGYSKLTVLSVLEDYEIRSLMEGGEVSGVTFDDMTKMSTKELKATFRKQSKAPAVSGRQDAPRSIPCIKWWGRNSFFDHYLESLPLQYF